MAIIGFFIFFLEIIDQDKNKAEKFVKYRDEVGIIKNIDEVKNVSGFGKTGLEIAQKFLFVDNEKIKKENVKMKYEITSQIPQKRGMGSSAAVSIAAIRAIFNYFRENLEDELLEKLTK